MSNSRIQNHCGSWNNELVVVVVAGQLVETRGGGFFSWLPSPRNPVAWVLDSVWETDLRHKVRVHFSKPVHAARASIGSASANPASLAATTCTTPAGDLTHLPLSHPFCAQRLSFLHSAQCDISVIYPKVHYIGFKGQNKSHLNMTICLCVCLLFMACSIIILICVYFFLIKWTVHLHSIPCLKCSYHFVEFLPFRHNQQPPNRRSSWCELTNWCKTYVHISIWVHWLC